MREQTERTTNQKLEEVAAQLKAIYSLLYVFVLIFLVWAIGPARFFTFWQIAGAVVIALVVVAVVAGLIWLVWAWLIEDVQAGSEQARQTWERQEVYDALSQKDPTLYPPRVYGRLEEKPNPPFSLRSRSEKMWCVAEVAGKLFVILLLSFITWFSIIEPTLRWFEAHR